MIYQIFNFFLEKKISKKRSVVRRFLENDGNKWRKALAEIHDGKNNAIKTVYGTDIVGVEKTIETIQQRQEVDKEYIFLIDHLKQDSKRRFMMNSNFYKYLKAMEYLYLTSNASVSGRVSMAPPEIYNTIKKVQESFKTMMYAYGIKK